MHTNTILPSSNKSSGSIVEAYNAVLALPFLVNNSKLNLLHTNLGLENICRNLMRIEKPDIREINKLHARGISEYLAGFTRYDGQIPASNMDELFRTLVTYPRINSVLPAMAPLVP